MSRLPKEIRNKIREEAKEWDTAIAGESVEDVQKQLNEAELFKAQRPPRQPVSLRLDPFDISMIKRLARKKGIPYTQLMTLWLHEKIDQERKSPVSAP
jgi:predicted DNA binding CopG/RHH family protein